MAVGKFRNLEQTLKDSADPDYRWIWFVDEFVAAPFFVPHPEVAVLRTVLPWLAGSLKTQPVPYPLS